MKATDDYARKVELIADELRKIRLLNIQEKEIEKKNNCPSGWRFGRRRGGVFIGERSVEE